MTEINIMTPFALRPMTIAMCSALMFGCANYQTPPEMRYMQARELSTEQNYTLISGQENNDKTGEAKPGDYVELDATQLRTAPLLRAYNNENGGSLNNIALPEESVKLNADSVPLEQFINLALGDVLNVNYIVDSSLAKQKTPVTLRVNTPVDSKRMLGLIEEVLLVNNVSLVIDDDLIKVVPSKKTSDQVPALFDKAVNPLLRYGKVLEIIPIYYLELGEASGVVRRYLSEGSGSGAKVLSQKNLNSLMVIAEREEIKKIYTLLAEIDVPDTVASNMTLVTPHYVSQENLVKDLTVSLGAAGIPVSLNKGSNGVVIIPLSNNSVLITATTKGWLTYSLNWVKQLDQPISQETSGGQNGIYAYYMQNAKAEDAWQVISALFSQMQNQETSDSTTQASDLVAAAQEAYANPGNQNSTSSSAGILPGNSATSRSSATQNSSSNQASMNVVTDKYRVVIDSNNNSVLFTGGYQDYQRLVELLKFVDKRPRQVLLEATIAEVSITDGYSFGFNFSGEGSDGSGSTTMSLASGGNLTLAGVFGDFTAEFNAALSNGKAHVLSSPRIIAMDKQEASIDVGAQIQVTSGSSTNTDTENTTKTYTYVSTGVSLSITPSINENGLVEMAVSQDVSSVGATRGDSPDINQRSLSTTLLANNGDTVFMGGLVTQNDSITETKVPFFGDIPVIGNLFKHQSVDKSSTELVLLLTPYVINNRDDALFYTKGFRELTGWELETYLPINQ